MKQSITRSHRIKLIDTLGIHSPCTIDVRTIRESPDGIVIRTVQNERIVLPAWDYRAGGPRYLIREVGAESPKQRSTKQPSASLDARINSYIDDLLGGEFDATRFAEQLRALSKRASNVLALERTVLQMGVQRLPDEQRDPVLQALRERFGTSPDESEYDVEAKIQAPRAGRAGPSS